MKANKGGATNLKVGSTNKLRAKRAEFFLYPLLFVQLLSLGGETGGEAPGSK